MLTDSIIGDIKHYFRYGNMVTRLIFVNIGVFLAVAIFHLVVWGAQSSALSDVYILILKRLEAPASLPHILQQPWSVFTYMFLHENLFHILFNMLWLFWFGEIFVLYMGDKKVLPLYILGGLAGAAMYVLVYNVIPVFKTGVDLSYMLGASASIYAIVFAAATLNPNHEINLILIGPVRIKYIALISLLLDIINIPYGNAGGYIAHTGGALSGFLYIKALQNGYDLFSPFAGVYNFITKLFRPKSSVKVSYKNVTGNGASSSQPRGKSEQEKVDEILDKIARSGYDSLTKEEKDFLFHFSKK